MIALSIMKGDGKVPNQQHHHHDPLGEGEHRLVGVHEGRWREKRSRRRTKSLNASSRLCCGCCCCCSDDPCSCHCHTTCRSAKCMVNHRRNCLGIPSGVPLMPLDSQLPHGGGVGVGGGGGKRKSSAGHHRRHHRRGYKARKELMTQLGQKMNSPEPGELVPVPLNVR